MMRRLAGLALLAALLAGSSNASAGPGQPEVPASADWATTFYVHQRVAELPSVLERLDRDGVFERPSARAPMTAFLSKVLARPDVRAEAVVGGTKVGSAGRLVLLDGLWLAGQGGRAVRLARSWKLESDRYAGKPPDLLTMPLREPGDLDMLWGAFMATGDLAYPRRLVDLLDVPEPFRPDGLQWTLLSGSARWSLQSNAQQHPTVLGLLRAEAARRTGPARPVLDELLAGLPGHGG